MNLQPDCIGRSPAPPSGLEPETCGLEVRCSIQLSYRGRGLVQPPEGDPFERVKGIEPSPPAWKAGALPLSYTRDHVHCKCWSGWSDLNRRPRRPKRRALPSCATARFGGQGTSGGPLVTDDCPVAKIRAGPLAQLAAQLTLNQTVPGSSPWRPTIHLRLRVGARGPLPFTKSSEKAAYSESSTMNRGVAEVSSCHVMVKLLPETLTV
jgi:hypothetical protein